MRTHRFLHFLLVPCVIAVSAILAGCQTTGGKTHIQAAQDTLPNGAPTLEEITLSLKAQDAALQNFRAAGTFTLESPKLKSVQRFPLGTVAYRRPADLYLVGRNKLNVTEFKLTSNGPKFLIEFPVVQNTDDRYYYSFEGEQFAQVPFSVSPADIAREMFMPVEWDADTAHSFRMTDYDPGSGRATLRLKTKEGLERTLVVAGKPWVIVHNTLTGRTGDTLSDTTMNNYADYNGVQFPSSVEAWFPGEKTRIAFEMRNIRVNTDLPDSMFTITWRPGQ